MTDPATDFDRISDFAWNEKAKTTLKKQTSQKKNEWERLNNTDKNKQKKAVHNYSAWKD